MIGTDSFKIFKMSAKSMELSHKKEKSISHLLRLYIFNKIYINLELYEKAEEWLKEEESA